MSVNPGEYGGIVLNNQWLVDVRSTPGSGPWIRVRAITNLVPAIADDVQDTGTYDSGIWGADSVLGRKWQLQLTLMRRNDQVTHDPGQELIRAAADDTPPGRIEVRWYQPAVGSGEAYSGIAMPQWAPQGGPKAGVVSVQCTLLGQGLRTTIAMPALVTTPVITQIREGGAVPSLATAGGDRIEIYGINLGGATGVTVGGVAATVLQQVSATLVTCATPARTAGQHPVVITTPAGSSAAVNVTYA